MSAASNYTETNVINALLRGVAFPLGVYIANKRERSMHVGSEDRRMAVDRDGNLRLRPERPLRVARESRRI